MRTRKQAAHAAVADKRIPDREKQARKAAGNNATTTLFHESGWRGEEYAYGNEKPTAAGGDEKITAGVAPGDDLMLLPPEIRIAAWVKILDTRLQAMYGEKYIPLPPVIPTKPDDLPMDNAKYKDGVIYVNMETQWDNSNDNISTIYHEYIHYLNEIQGKYISATDPVTGSIIQFDTDETITFPVTEKDKKDYGEAFDEFEAPNYRQNKFTEEQIVKKRDEYIARYAVPDERTFHYAPSNLALDEISAYTAQLDGEKSGIYKLSDKAREDIQSRLERLKIIYARRVRYETEHQLNPDGTRQE